MTTRRRDVTRGVLSGPVDGPARAHAVYPELPAVPGLRVRHRASGFDGIVVRCERDAVAVRGATGLERLFSLAPGAFLLEGAAVSLVRPPRAVPPAARRTASGSVPLAAPPRVARPGRLLVEGVHDAELVEKVWGDDLRVEGVVVERLDGVDILPGVVRTFAPGPGRRLGVLVDHLVPDSKEARLGASVRSEHVLVTGHPFVDVWQGVRPGVLGLAAWPAVPRGRPWKQGVCEALDVPDPARLWRHILASVRSYADLEPSLVGAVERLIDFVTEA